VRIFATLRCVSKSPAPVRTKDCSVWSTPGSTVRSMGFAYGLRFGWHALGLARNLDPAHLARRGETRGIAVVETHHGHRDLGSSATNHFLGIQAFRKRKDLFPTEETEPALDSGCTTLMHNLHSPRAAPHVTGSKGGWEHLVYSASLLLAT
jgi:hypothetical protein